MSCGTSRRSQRCETQPARRHLLQCVGITWTGRTSAANNSWFSVTYGGGLFVAVSYNGTGNRVMTGGVSGAGPSLEPAEWTRYTQALPMPATGTCQDFTAEQNSFAAYGTGVTERRFGHTAGSLSYEQAGDASRVLASSRSSRLIRPC